MKRLVGVLTALSLLFTTVLVSAAKGQEPTSDLPVLEMPTATSADALTELEDRNTEMDYGLLFMPEGSGGERLSSKWTGYMQEDLDPVAAGFNRDLNSATVAVAIPAYANSEQNETLTQVDRRHLTVSAPTVSDSAPPLSPASSP